MVLAAAWGSPLAPTLLSRSYVARPRQRTPCTRKSTRGAVKEHGTDRIRGVGLWACLLLGSALAAMRYRPGVCLKVSWETSKTCNREGLDSDIASV